METFSLRDDLVSSGLHFNGWRDQRRLDEQTSTLEFTFSKSYVAQDAQFISDEYYRIHQNGDEYNRVMLGPNVRIFYEVIQDVTPDMCIVRCVERYPDMPVNIHMLALIFRVQTANGYIQGVKSIAAAELERATAEEDAAWASDFHVTSFDVLQRDHNGRCTGYKTSVSGSISSVNAQFVHRWMVEAIVAVVRSERMLMGQRLLC